MLGFEGFRAGCGRGFGLVGFGLTAIAEPGEPVFGGRLSWLSWLG